MRDKPIISLFADSGLRLRELASIETQNIDWQNLLIKVKCKGGKEGLAAVSYRLVGSNPRTRPQLNTLSIQFSGSEEPFLQIPY